MNDFVSVIRVPPEMEDAFRILREYVEQTLKRSGYQNIKLSNIFQHPKTLILNYQHMSEG